MRTSILAFALAAALLLSVTCAVPCFSLAMANGSFGFSSDELLGGGSYLGVDTRDVTADQLGALQLKEERGVEVTMVDQDAPAGKAGVKEHDVILSVNGAEVESVEQLRRMIHEIPAGRVVTLGISRNGQPLTIKAQLAQRKEMFGNFPKVKEFNFTLPAVPVIAPLPSMPDMDLPVSIVVVHSSTRSGLMVENLTPQLGDYFGARNGQGVLVRSVEKGSRAEKAGFHAGDVIVKVQGEAVHDTGDFTHALRSKTETVSVGIIRDKKEQTISLTLPPRKGADLMEESFDEPTLDADTRMEISEVQSEVAKLKPQMELAAREMKQVQEQAKDECKRQKVEIKKHVQRLHRNLRNQRNEIQREFRWNWSGADI